VGRAGPEASAGPWEKFRLLVTWFETRPWTGRSILLVLAGVIALRNLLELAVGRNPAWPLLASFVHYPLAYVAPFVALTLVLSFWARVEPLRVARLMTLAWLLTLLPPLADLVMHSGADRPVIAYLQADAQDLPWIWLRFLDPRVELAGTTPGIRVEAFLAVALAFVYVLLRARSLSRAGLAAACVYVTCLGFFSLPRLVHGAFSVLFSGISWDAFMLGGGVLDRSAAVSGEDAIAIFWLAPLVLALTVGWRRLEARLGASIPLRSRAVERSVAGFGPFLAGALLSGLLAGLLLRGATGPAIAVAPFDLLAVFGGVLALVTGARLATGSATRCAFARTLALACLFALVAAAGPATAVGLAAALGPLLVIGSGLLPAPPAWRDPLLAGLAIAASLGSVYAGFALVVGSEAVARMPAEIVLPAALLAPLLPFLAAGGSALRVFAGPALAAGIASGAAVAMLPGPWTALLVAAPLAATVIVGSAIASGLVGAARGAKLSGAVIGLLSAAVLAIGLAQPETRASLEQATNCVARLEWIHGREAADRGQWIVAERHYLRSLECDPDYTPALRSIGIAQSRRGEVQAAIDTFERVLVAEPDSAQNLNNLAGAKLQAGLAADALPLLERAAQLEPRHLDTRFNLARALDSTGRADRAIDAWLRYIALAEGRAEEARHLELARARIEDLRPADREDGRMGAGR
jgi:hypothetical protein